MENIQPRANNDHNPGQRQKIWQIAKHQIAKANGAYHFKVMQRSQCGRGRKPQRVSDEQMRQAGKDTNTKQPELGDPLGHDRRKQRA